MTEVHELYVAAGYRAPIKDGGRRRTPQTDVYLANMGDEGLYGYGTADVDEHNVPDWVDGWTVAMQVTAAHEYFHAVQFAYDASDDTRIYVTTATWAADEVYDDVNDNWSYLPTGQLGDPRASENLVSEGPGVSLDLGDFAYGNWIFHRYLTERLTAEEGGLPTLGTSGASSTRPTTGLTPPRCGPSATCSLSGAPR